MSDALQALGAMTMLGIRGATPGDPELEEDLDACAAAGVRMIILFDHDIATKKVRNVRTPEQVRTLTDYVRARLGVDTLIAVDQEGGRVQRLSPKNGFTGWPSAKEIARCSADEQYHHARTMALALSEAGISINFAPCVDVDRNPESPVIGSLGRAYAHDPGAVAACAERLIRAHQECEVTCVLKHFPGHGSATSDSHFALPDISNTWNSQLDLSPYRQLLSDSVGVMTGHLIITSLDESLPASLSRRITTGLLRDQLGFDGPVFTDSLDMEGVRAQWTMQEAFTLALKAGADVLVHACNSKRGEYAPAVVRELSAVAEQMDQIPSLSEAARKRVQSLTTRCGR